MEGFNWYLEISKVCDTTLVTHERNREALLKRFNEKQIIFIAESSLVRSYYRYVTKISIRGQRTNWPLYHVLSYPVYESFNKKAFKITRELLRQSKYSVVHSITPMIPRYPVKSLSACIEKNIPFVLGPVNGGVPFPKGFSNVARKEHAYLNFLRSLGSRMIPSLKKTYTKSTKILAGSTFTYTDLKQRYCLNDSNLSLFYENGIPESFVMNKASNSDRFLQEPDVFNLLFVGRLVPYKGVDLLIESQSSALLSRACSGSSVVPFGAR